MRLGERVYDLDSRALVMGTVGAGADVEGACRRAEQLVADGADLLQVGGLGVGALDSGERAVDDGESLVAAVAALGRRVRVPLAVVTRDGEVARRCFGAGAAMACFAGGSPGGSSGSARGSSGSGGDAGDVMAAAADAGAAVVLGLSPAASGRGGPAGDSSAHPEPASAGGGPAETVRGFLRSLAALARRAEHAGVAPDRIALDAGLDLAHAAALAGALLRAPGGLVAIGYPVVLTVSGVAAAASAGADCSTPAEAALGVALGCRIVRTHDVLGARRACDLIAAIYGSEPRRASDLALPGARR